MAGRICPSVQQRYSNIVHGIIQLVFSVCLCNVRVLVPDYSVHLM